ncbi:MAG TPA: YggT family protein [Caulobacter sp.]|nr:YggT family protein [Caulobacter sp.]
MYSILGLVFWLAHQLLNLVVLALILNAILSWLVAFDIINLRNRFVYQFSHFLDAVTRPLLAPIRKVVPSLGGVDITPIILILLITGVQRFILRGIAVSLGVDY